MITWPCALANSGREMRTRAAGNCHNSMHIMNKPAVLYAIAYTEPRWEIFPGQKKNGGGKYIFAKKVSQGWRLSPLSLNCRGMARMGARPFNLNLYPVYIAGDKRLSNIE